MSEGGVAQLAPPSTLPDGFTVTLQSTDNTRAVCSYVNGQLTCSYNNGNKGDGRTDAMYLNVGGGSTFTVTESAWIVNEQVSPRTGIPVSAADEWVTCGANKVRACVTCAYARVWCASM